MIQFNMPWEFGFLLRAIAIFTLSNQESAITILPVPWKSVVRRKVVAHIAPYFDTCSFSFIVSLPSYNSSLTAMHDLASARSFISFPIGCSFLLIFIFHFRLRWYDLIILSSSVIIFPGVRAWSKLSLTAERNSMIWLSLPGSNGNWRNDIISSNLWHDMYLEKFIFGNRLESDSDVFF